MIDWLIDWFDCLIDNMHKVCNSKCIYWPVTLAAPAVLTIWARRLTMFRRLVEWRGSFKPSASSTPGGWWFLRRFLRLPAGGRGKSGTTAEPAAVTAELPVTDAGGLRFCADGVPVAADTAVCSELVDGLTTGSRRPSRTWTSTCVSPLASSPPKLSCCRSKAADNGFQSNLPPARGRSATKS